MPAVAVLPFYRIGATPLALEIMRIYNAGSSVYASVYADAAGTTPMGNSDIVPIQANAAGLFPVVFVPVDGAYDIKYYSSDLVPRDTYQGIKPIGGGTGPGSDTHTVLVDGLDSSPGYLLDKLLDSPGLVWSVIDNAGSKQLQPLLQTTVILDGKVKVSAGDGVPGFLSAKLQPGTGVLVLDNGSTLDVSVSTPWLSGWINQWLTDNYHPLPSIQNGLVWVSDVDGKPTGHVNLSYSGTVLSVPAINTANIALSYLMRAESNTGRLDLTPDLISMVGMDGGVPDSSISWYLDRNGFRAQSIYGTWDIIVDRFGRNGQLPGRVQFSAEIDGPGTQAYIVDDDKLLYDGAKLTVPALKIDNVGAGRLGTDVDGNVVIVPASDNKVAVDASDTILGYLETKIVAGTGIRITETTDSVNGKVMHVSTTAAGSGLAGYRSREMTFAQRESHPVTTPFNAMSLTIPAGTWDITALGCYNCGVGSGSYAQLFAAISTVSNTLTNDAYQGFSSPCPYMAANPGFTQSVTLAPKRMTFAVDTTIYLVLQHWGSIANGGASWGHITAREVLV